MDPRTISIPRRENLPAQNIHKRSGLVPLCIGASHGVRDAKGVFRIYEAYNHEACKRTAADEGRTLSIKVIHLESSRLFDSMDALHAAVGDAVTLQLHGTAVTWAYFSSDPWAPDQAERLAAIDREMDGRRAVIKKLGIELQSPKDAEHFDVLRGRIEGQMKALEQNARDRTHLVESVIGLLSDSLMSHEFPAERTIATSMLAGGVDAPPTA